MTHSLESVEILLVEDNPADVEITKRALSKAGVSNSLTVARDGQEAVDALFGRGDDRALPGLVLLDLNLPRVSGIEVLTRLKADARLRRIPVIVMTSSSREEDVTMCYDLGVNTFISKPVTFEDSLNVFATIEKYWLGIATLPPRIRHGGA